MNKHDFIDKVQVFQAKMYRIACRILISEDAAKDAVQEVLLKLWEKRDEIHKFNSFEAYAMQMTKNKSLDELKLKANQNLRIVHENFEAENSDEVHKDFEEEGLRLNVIKEAIDQLPNQQKMVMQLRDIENYSFEEIAAILEITEVAVRVNLSRARKNVIQNLKNKNVYETQAK